MAIKISNKFLTVDGTRVGVTFATGPWIGGVNPDLIKIRPRKSSSFPTSFRSAFTVENNSNGGEDYFEADCIRILPGHPLYDQVKEVA
jgi:hypothetical protein